MKQNADRQDLSRHAPAEGQALHINRQFSVEHRERLLDEALNQSFPASDPPSICQAQGWAADDGPQQLRLDKAGPSAILNNMSERSQFGPPELHPGSSTARF